MPMNELDKTIWWEGKMKERIDSLSTEAKQWLHHTAQQCNDPGADGYIDDPKLRAECVAAGVIVQLRGKRIEIDGYVNNLVYSEGYLSQYS